MSELIKNGSTGSTARLRFLSTVSAIAILGAAVGEPANAESDDSRPTVWIQLGGQLERISPTQAPYLPSYTSGALENGFDSPAGAQHAARNALGFEGDIRFQPEGSDWVFSAGLRYGRSKASGHQHQQKDATISGHYTYTPTKVFKSTFGLFSDSQAENRNSHTVLDFKAGKDVGIGVFGSGGSSVFSAGVRFAQFGSSSSGTFRARPDSKLSIHQSEVSVYHPAFTPFPSFLPSYTIPAHTTTHVTTHKIFELPRYTAVLNATRSFRGWGPSLSWDASVPVAGNKDTAEVTFDWGANAAVLFGRQKANITFNGTTAIANQSAPAIATASSRARSRTVIVPNIGGFAGMSLKFPNANVSLGYRADYFINAMDTGFDTRSKSNIGFFGPFASVSIGLGG